MKKKKTYIVDQLNKMIMRDELTPWELIEACSFIDINYQEPTFEPPIDFVEEWQKRHEALTSPFRTIIERRSGTHGMLLKLNVQEVSRLPIR